MQRYRGLFIMIVFLMSVIVIDRNHMPTLTAQVPSVPVITLPKAKATDRVPVIVTLKNTNGLESPFDSAKTVEIKSRRLKMHF